MMNTPHSCTGSDDPGTASDSDIRPDPADEKVDLALVARLSTLGELVASIVHEINQPLGTIAMQANTCLARLRHDNPDLEAVGEGLVRIERAAMRAGGVIRGLMTLARRSGLQLADVDMNKVIGEVLTLARSEMGQHGITLDSNLDTGNRSVQGDRVLLQQVLLNLVMNGIESMRATADLPRVLSVSSEPWGAGGVLVTVEDTGGGLDPAIAERIFDPLFTTKPKGMGMGLSICRSIIEAHGGRIWASPRIPHGAIFRFIVPSAGEMTGGVQPGLEPDVGR